MRTRRLKRAMGSGRRICTTPQGCRRSPAALPLPLLCLPWHCHPSHRGHFLPCPCPRSLLLLHLCHLGRHLLLRLRFRFLLHSHRLRVAWAWIEHRAFSLGPTLRTVRRLRLRPPPPSPPPVARTASVTRRWAFFSCDSLLSPALPPRALRHCAPRWPRPLPTPLVPPLHTRPHRLPPPPARPLPPPLRLRLPLPLPRHRHGV